MQDKDPYVPSDKEVAECNDIFAQLAKQNEEIDAKAARRRKNRGPDKAMAGRWRDNPKGTAHWKATIAGLADAYKDVTGKRGDALDLIADAAGISNAAFGQNARPRHPNAIGAVTKRRAYSPGDAGKLVRDFIKSTKQSKDPSVGRTYRDARNGKVLISARGRSPTQAGCQSHSMVEAIKEAKRTKSRADRDRACAMILSVAEAYGEGRWLFHGKRKPRSTRLGLVEPHLSPGN